MNPSLPTRLLPPSEVLGPGGPGFYLLMNGEPHPSLKILPVSLWPHRCHLLLETVSLREDGGSAE